MKHKLISTLLVITIVLGIFAVPCSAMAAEIATNEPALEAEESEKTDEIGAQLPTDDYTVGADDNSDEQIAESDNTEDLGEAPTEAAEKPAAPVLSIANGINGLDFAWSKVDNAENYIVYFKTASDEEWMRFGTPDTHGTASDVEPGKLYYAKVQSRGANDSEGEFSATKSMTYIPRAEITALSFNGSANTLTWKNVGGANKYQIAKIRIGDKAYSYFTTTSNTFTDTSVVKSNTYYYQVRAMYATANNGTAYGAWSASKQVVTLSQPVVSLSNKSNGIRAQWNAVGGASKYVVYYKSADDSSWSSVTTTNTYYPLLSVKSGVLYFVQVRPVSGKLNGSYSRVKSMTFIGRSDVTLSNAADGINVGLKSIDGANRYQIAKKKKGTTSYSYYYTSNASYIDSDVAGGTEYIYQSRAMYETENSGTAYGAWSTSKSLQRLVQPTVSLSNKSNGLRVDWSKVAGATKYVVYIKAASASSWQSATTTNTYYPMLTVKSGTLYYVQVRPIGNGVYGPFSQVKSMTFIGQVTPKLSLSGNGLTLSWSGVSGANKYKIAKIKKGASSYEYFTVQGTSYVDTAVAGSNDWYTYQIRALYETENSGTAYGAWSDSYNIYNGKVLSGYITLSGYKYYYQNGVLQKGRIVGTSGEGYYYADASGICCTSEEMRLAAEFIMTCGTGKTLDERMKTSFKYLATKIPYKRTYDHPQSKADIPALAIDMFKNKKGNCYRYAACFTCIAKICGYRTRMCAGNTSNGNPHGWTEVYMDGKWYYFDPDMQLPSWGFPDYAAYKMSTHPWKVTAKFKTELTISNGKAVWN